MKKLKDLPKDMFKAVKEVGLETDENKLAGTYIHQDHENLISDVKQSEKEKLVLMDIRVALKKYDWIKNYFWKAVDRNKDEYTKYVDENMGGGYFIWVKKGAKLDVPIQSCMIIKGNNFKQVVHNLVIIDEGAQANLLTGCFNHPDAHTGEHLGISEFYIKKGAYLNFTMVHDWNKSAFVRPRSTAIVEDNANFVSNYIILSPVKDLQTYPATILNGKDSKAILTSLMFGQGSSSIDVGGKVELIGDGSKGNIISRAIATDSSKMFARGMIVGDNKDSKAHLECQGLLLSEKANISAIPELIAKKEGADLSHEAAVGKIAEEELIYLMSRGLSREDATNVIVRGFLDVKILGLPKEFRARIQGLIDQVGDGF